MNVFIHSCSKEGNSHSIFFNFNDHCSQKKNIQSSCCAPKKVQKDCCKNEVKTYKAKFEYSQSIDFQIPYLAIDLIQPIFNFSQFQPEVVTVLIASTRPPPKPKGQQLLILNNVFRI